MRDASTWREVLRALPSFVAYGQLGLIASIDGLTVGPLGVTPLAAVGFAANVVAPAYILATGIALALPPILARSAPGGAAVWLRGCLAAQALVAAVGVAVLLLLSGHLGVFRQPPAVAQAARPYLLGMTFALIPVFAFSALREVAIALGRPAAPGAFAALAIAVKVLLGAALVHGRAGAPPLGALGAAVATSIGYGAAVLLFALYLSRRGLSPWPGRGARFAAALLRQGLPIALQQLFEVGAFHLVGIMAGWLGASALAGHHVALNVVNSAALVSLSIAQSTSAQVGRRAALPPGAAARAAMRGAATALAAMSVAGLALIHMRGTLFRAAPELAALALLVAPALLADGVQMALAGALRGLLDARFLSIVTFVCWWLFCLPLAHVLAFERGYGVYGLWAALAATLVVTAVVFVLRLAVLAGGGRPRSTPTRRGSCTP